MSLKQRSKAPVRWRPHRGLLILILMCVPMLGVADLGREQRDAMERAVISGLAGESQDPLVTGCWRAYREGAEEALSALYIIARAMDIIVRISGITQDIIVRSGISADSGRALSELYADPAVVRQKRLLKALPAAMDYCRGASESVDVGASVGDAATPYLEIINSR